MSGCGLVATASSVGAYADTLFWVRALQVVLLLLVAPFGLALGMPLTVLRDACSTRGRARFDHVLGSRAARAVTHPAVTSGVILVTPWLFYLTPWYTAVLRGRRPRRAHPDAVPRRRARLLRDTTPTRPRAASPARSRCRC
ncbi:MAG: cytochrome c oxidase assembly protein [Gordonia paraffinivorans]